MPRTVRGLADGFIYHVLNRGNGKQLIFHKPQDYDAFLNLIVESKSKYSVKILSYCLMPNHFHMLILPNQANDLSLWMQWLMTSHVRRYHRHYGGSGHVWQGRFKSFIVKTDYHLLTVSRYIEANPVRAGLIKSAKNWTWSSHRETLGIARLAVTDKLPLNLPNDWTSYVDKPISLNELKKIRECVHRQAPFGNLEWKTEICKRLGLESRIRSIGRPFKENVTN